MKINLTPLLRRVVRLLPVCAAAHLWACGEGSLTLTSLPTLGGAAFQVNALNGAGQMTGFAYTADNLAAHAYLLGSNTLVDLGTLGGAISYGAAINAGGMVVGQADVDFGSVAHAFLYDGNSLVDLGTLGGFYSTAAAINDAGFVAGTSLTTGDAALHAFLHANGVMTDLGTLGGSSSSAVAINQAGSVAGDSYTIGDWEYHAFLYRAGAMTDLGTLGGEYSATFALGEGDIVVGESALPDWQVHAFAWQAGVMHDLGTLGGTYSTASAINTNHQIIGEATTAGDSETHGFVYQSGVLTDLGTLGGGFSSPNAINNLGQIVGGSLTSQGRFHAFLWQDGTMTDLNTLLPPDSDWELMNARFINDRGLIVGYGFRNGSFEWFALEPGAAANHAPTAVVSGPQSADCGTAVTLDGTASSDPDNDPLTYEWSEGPVVLGTNATLTATFDLGAHTITLKVTDACGDFALATATFTVADQTAPTIQRLAATPDVLSPPNNQLVPVTLTVEATDNCDPAPVSRILSITANGPVSPDDIQITGDLTVNLAAAKSTSGTERIYTIVVGCADAAGNTATRSVTVSVPKSKGNSAHPKQP